MQRVGKLGLAVMLCVAVTVAWGVGVAILGNTIWSVLYQIPPEEYHQIEFDVDATPIILVSHIGSSVVEHRTLDGELILDSPDRQADGQRSRISHSEDYLGSDNSEYVFLRWPGVIEEATEWSSFSEPLAWDVRLRSWNIRSLEQGNRQIAWQFRYPARRPGRGYFVGWDRDESRRIGYLGLNGFTSDLPREEEQFPTFGTSHDETISFPNTWAGTGQVANTLNVISPQRDRVHQVRFGSREVREVYSGPKNSVRGFAHLAHWLPDGTDLHSPLQIVLNDQIRVLDKNLEVLRTIRLPFPLPATSCRLVTKADGDLWAEIADHNFGNGTHRSRLVRFNEAGNILEDRELTLRSGHTFEAHRTEDKAGMAALLSPLFIGLRLNLEAKNRLMDADGRIIDSRTFEDFCIGLRQGAVIFWLPATFVMLVSIALVVVSQRRLRRIGASRFDRMTWGALILLFGGAGYLAFLVHRRWPPHSACPACGHDAPRDRGECLACGAKFAAPARNGCELFA